MSQYVLNRSGYRPNAPLPQVPAPFAAGPLAGRKPVQVLKSKLTGDGPWILTLGSIIPAFAGADNGAPEPPTAPTSMRAWVRVTTASHDSKAPARVRYAIWPVYGGRMQVEGSDILVEALCEEPTSPVGGELGVWITQGQLATRQPFYWQQDRFTLVPPEDEVSLLVPPGAVRIHLLFDTIPRDQIFLQFGAEDFAGVGRVAFAPLQQPSASPPPDVNNWGIVGAPSVLVPPGAVRVNVVNPDAQAISMCLFWEVDL